MRVRHALIGMALGSALALGGTAVTAEAAVPVRTADVSGGAASAAAEPSRHWVGSYATQAECQAAGRATGAEKFTCEFFFFDGLFNRWMLYTWS